MSLTEQQSDFCHPARWSGVGAGTRVYLSHRGYKPFRRIRSIGTYMSSNTSPSTVARLTRHLEDPSGHEAEQASISKLTQVRVFPSTQRSPEASSSRREIYLSSLYCFPYVSPKKTGQPSSQSSGEHLSDPNSHEAGKMSISGRSPPEHLSSNPDRPENSGDISSHSDVIFQLRLPSVHRC